MSAVVLRCPGCGSAQDLPGACGACHAADVRYFCANHTPGRWLDAPSCAECGAHLGFDPFPQASASKPTGRRPATPPPLRPGPRATRPTAPPPPAAAQATTPPRGVGRSARRPERNGGALPPWLGLPPGRPPRRRGRAHAARPEQGAAPFPAESPSGPRLAATSTGGCALRVVLAAALAILFALGAAVLWMARG